MLTGTRAEAHRLNRIARQQLIESGEIDITQQFVIDQHQFAPGDHVLLRRNDRGQHLANRTAFGVDNGMRATITGIDDRGVHVTLSTGEQVVLDRSYVADGWVEYAYASTIHTAQGVTCDHVLLIGPAGLYREGIYVALSRARLSAWIYATTTQAAEIERHDTGIPLPTDTNRIPEHELVARMHAVLRRSPGSVPPAKRVEWGSIWLDSATRQAGVGDERLTLKKREFDLLAFFLRNPERAWTRLQLLENVWGPDYACELRAVDLNVARLRSRLEKAGSEGNRARCIHTVWGVGYRLAEEH